MNIRTEKGIEQKVIREAEKHKAWLIGGIVFVVLALGILLYPSLSGNFAGKAIVTNVPVGLEAWFELDEGVNEVVSGIPGTYSGVMRDGLVPCSGTSCSWNTANGPGSSSFDAHYDVDIEISGLGVDPSIGSTDGFSISFLLRPIWYGSENRLEFGLGMSRWN
jgi:hypothetical protein